MSNCSFHFGSSFIENLEQIVVIAEANRERIGRVRRTLESKEKYQMIYQAIDLLG